MFYWHSNPDWLARLFPEVIWHKSRTAKKIYLTFDDGPVPDATEFVLDQLEQYKAKATFFCVGENVEKHSSIFQKVKTAGHKVGNHTYNHLNGWENNFLPYMKNVEACDSVMVEAGVCFRPPYGKLTMKQYREIKKDREIVMWDILTGDFDAELSPKQCLNNSIKHTKNGSVVVFHDSLKNITTLTEVLPKYLKHFDELGYEFAAL